MTPNIQRIKRLLSLYESGLSSIIQERELTRLLSDAQDLPEELKDYRDMILGVSRKIDVEVPSDLDASLSNTVDRLERVETAGRRGNRWIMRAGIAASAMIVISIAGFLIKESRPSPYEITDPAEASECTKEAIITVAQELREADRAVKESCVILNKLLSSETTDSLDAEMEIESGGIDSDTENTDIHHSNRI